MALGGIITNACVETTTRSVAMRALEITVLSDRWITFSANNQNASLTNLE